MRRAAQLAIALCSVLFLTGCEEDNWGDQAADFVDKEVPGMSRRYVTAHLQKVWADAVFTTTAESALRLKEGAEMLAAMDEINLERLDAFSLGELTEIYLNIDENRSLLVRALQQATELQETLQTIQNACVNEALFWGTDLPSLGYSGPMSTLAPVLNKNKGEVRFEVHFGSGGPQGNENEERNKAIWETLSGLWKFAAQVDQDRRLQEAVRRIPHVVLTADQVWELNKQICSDELKKFSVNLSEISGSADSLVEAIHSRLDVFASAADAVAYQLRPIEIKKYLEITGIAEKFSEIQLALAQGKTGYEFELAINNIIAERRKVDEENRCLEKFLAAENYQGAIVELLAQIDAFRPKIVEPQLSERMDKAKTILIERRAGVKEIFSSIKQNSCS